MAQLVRCVKPDGSVFWSRQRHGAPAPPTQSELKLKEISNVQNPTVAWARRHGIRATKLQGPGNRSQPDYCFWMKGGRPFIVEFKRPGEYPTALQSDTIRQYMEDGYDIEVHDTKESAIEALTKRMP